MLDPAVEILDTEVDEFSLLCHTATAVGMAVPPGEGLLDFVKSLMGKPIRVGELREEYDGRELIDEMLSPCSPTNSPASRRVMGQRR